MTAVNPMIFHLIKLYYNDRRIVSYGLPVEFLICNRLSGPNDLYLHWNLSGCAQVNCIKCVVLQLSSESSLAFRWTSKCDQEQGGVSVYTD